MTGEDTGDAPHARKSGTDGLEFGPDEWAAFLDGDEVTRTERNAVLAGYAADSVSDCRCGKDPSDAPDEFIDEAVAAVEEWLGRHTPLSRREFDELRSRFAREPGRPAVKPSGGSGPKNVHLREVDATTLGTWVADADVALVDLDDAVRWADLHGVPVGDDEVAPLVVAAGGPFSDAARAFHTHYHGLQRVRDRVGGSGQVMTDGGPDGLSVDEWARVFDGADVLPAVEIAERLAAARDLSVAKAQERVYAAEDDGVLVEADAGAPSALRLAERGSGDSEAASAGGDEVKDGRGQEIDDAPRAPSADEWTDLSFADLEGETWPLAHRDVDAWMLRNDSKAPWSPWTDPDAPVACSHAEHDEPTTCAECDHSARYKWGSDGSREHVHAEYETALEWREMHPRANGDLVFIQRERDPFAFVDGDDVRDPETGEVHPEFLRILDELGLTYADVSTSGSGAHAMYRGELPDGVKQAVFEIDDEAFGANDAGDRPTVEIYDGKKVCVATGDHVVGSGLQVREWDALALEDVLDEYDQLPDRERPAEAFDDFDAAEYEPDATDADETTDDIRDVFAALDRLDARRVAERTIVREWIDPSGADDRAFVPTWAPAGYDGTANFANRRAWTDSGERGGYGGPACMAAIDAGLVRDDECPEAVRGETWFKAVDHLRELGFDIPRLEDDAGEEYDDPREVEAVVDPGRAWDAAGRVEYDDLEEAGDLESAGHRFACPRCGEAVDVVRAVAVERDIISACDHDLDAEGYPEAYTVAREEYGAPLPRYLTTTDAVAEFDAVLSVIGEVGFFHLDRDALRSDVTAEGDEVGGEAVRALDPAWRDSESGESVLVFESGVVWDAKTERTIDALRFVALDAGMILTPGESLQGERFTTAYRLARDEYGAPLPRWDPAADGERAVTPMLPPSDELVDEPDAVAVDRDRLQDARDDVEALVREAATDAENPQVVTSLPATGKTTGFIKSAADRPSSYLAPRKELQQQALDTAAEWGVDAMLLPVFSDAPTDRDVVAEAVAHVRERGKDRLRDRWAVLDAVEGDLFTDREDDEAVDLDRATCATADGEHGEAWALVFQVARRLGYTPREIHHHDEGLFGTEAPCGDECPYSQAWERVREGEHDLLIGSYGHANVESVRTFYAHGEDGVERSVRAVAYDEFPGQAHEREFGEEAVDHATWLAAALSPAVDDRHDLLQTDLWSDEFVRAWLDGEADALDAVQDAAAALGWRERRLDVREAAADMLERVDADTLEAFGLADPLRGAAASGADLEAVYDDLRAGYDNAMEQAPGLASWVLDAVGDPLGELLAYSSDRPEVGGLPGGGELRQLVERAVAAADAGEDGARGVLQAARDALRGGDEGARALAAWADDGYAHPAAHHLLQAVITPTDAPEATTVATSAFAFDPEATDGTHLQRVRTGERTTVLLDRNHHGAILHDPPARTAGNGEPAPVLGLDATGRERLWSLALGEPVTSVDIHDTPRHRAQFLRDVLGLQIVQCSDKMRAYSGSPAGKDLDGDVALVEAVAEEFVGIQAPRERGADPVPVGNPAVVTTKGVKSVLEDDHRLDDIVADWENYGNLTGANDLGDHRLATILGSQHYGDDAVERMAALAGEEADTSRATGYGTALDYGSDVANTYLQHMREDQVMQAALRFARGESGATVFVRTAAVREDLPVVGRGQVAETWNETATEIARKWRAIGEGAFTRADVEDVVDVSSRQVRRVLAEFVEAGYLSREVSGSGVANSYVPEGDPGSGEVDLPTTARPDADPGQVDSKQYYTWNVRVSGVDTPPIGPYSGTTRPRGAPPAPGSVPERAAAGIDPPD